MISRFFSTKPVAVFFLFISMVVSLSPGAYAQKQLIIMKREKIMLRLHPGDDIVYRMKGSKTKIRSYINNLFDTAVLVHRTIVPFHRIDRVYFTKGSFMNVVGGLLVGGGVGYFAIDELNETVVHGHKFSISDRVVKTSAIMVVAGLPMLIIKRKSTRIGWKFRMMTVGPDSPFYLNDVQRVDF